MDGVHAIDWFRAMGAWVAADDQRSLADLVDDGLHLSIAGNKLLADTVLDGVAAHTPALVPSPDAARLFLPDFSQINEAHAADPAGFFNAMDAS